MVVRTNKNFTVICRWKREGKVKRTQKSGDYLVDLIEYMRSNFGDMIISIKLKQNFKDTSFNARLERARARILSRIKGDVKNELSN